MFDQGKVVTLIPGQSGKGGAKTAVPSMDMVPDIRDAKNIMVKNGRWENVLGFTTIQNATGPTSNASLYCYSYHSTSVPVTTTTKVLAAGIKSGTGHIYNMTDNATLVTLATGGVPASFETVKEKCLFSDGATKPQIIDGQNAMAVYTWGIRDGIGSTASPGTLTITYDTTVTELTTTFNVVAGNTQISYVAGNPLLAGYQGKTIWLKGNENTVPGNRHTITSVDLIGGHLTVDPAPVAAEAGTPVATQINFGNMTWTQGAPKYACSWYDSTRAHSGNIGAIVQPPEAVKYNVDLLIQFTGDNTGDLARCDKVILWSSPAFVPSGNLYTLSVSNNAPGAILVADQRTDDSQLGVQIGPFQAPFQTNNPPKYFSYVAYWNGVMWGLSPTGPLSSDFDLSLLYYSRQDDPSLLGRGEESWPLVNFLRIPAKDGRGLGLAVVGDTLCVLTERYIYTVAGASDGSYRLVQLSSKGFGVGQFQMAEYTGDSTKSTAAMIYLGQDRQIWAQAIGDVPVAISTPIQDQIDAALRGPTFAALYPNTRVHYLTYSGDSYAVILLS